MKLLLYISLLLLVACSPGADDQTPDVTAFTNWLAHAAATAPPATAERVMNMAAVAEALSSLDGEALQALLADDFQSHNPMLADGREGLLSLTHEEHRPRGGGDNFMANTAHVLAQDDHVLLHRGGRLGPLASVNMDVFRFNESGQLAEQWSFVQPVEAGFIDNLLFSFVVPRQLDLIPTRDIPGPGLLRSVSDYALPVRVSAAGVQSNSEQVRAYLAELHGERQRQKLEQFLHPEFFIHLPCVEPGRVAWLDVLGRGRQRPALPQIEKLIAQNDLVWVLTRMPHIVEEDVPELAVADLFRVRDGLIVEQWKLVQPSPRFSRNQNGLF